MISSKSFAHQSPNPPSLYSQNYMTQEHPDSTSLQADLLEQQRQFSYKRHVIQQNLAKLA
jgi:hypothetical protein